MTHKKGRLNKTSHIRNGPYYKGKDQEFHLSQDRHPNRVSPKPRTNSRVRPDCSLRSIICDLSFYTYLSKLIKTSK